MIAHLLATSDVLGTGWFAKDAANVKPGMTVAVVGDGAVGLLAVLSAKQKGAERIIAMSRHEKRQKLALEFGVTDIVTERGDEGVARIKDMTKGVGADAVLECVGTQESMMQAIGSTRPGGNVSYVGVPHDVELKGEELFFPRVHLHGGIIPTLEELGIGLVPYSPLGRGYLTGTITEDTKFDPNDNRGTFPRFSPEALKANRGLVDVIEAFAAQKHATPAQIALAWLLAQRPWIVPIPGTTRLHRLEENIGSICVELTANDLQELDRATAEIPVKGDRYPPDLERMTYR